jgi:hypothetical protein
MALQLKDMTKWLADSCTKFAVVSGDVGHPLHDVARQKLYFFHYGTYSRENNTAMERSQAGLTYRTVVSLDAVCQQKCATRDSVFLYISTFTRGCGFETLNIMRLRFSTCVSFFILLQ